MWTGTVEFTDFHFILIQLGILAPINWTFSNVSCSFILFFISTTDSDRVVNSPSDKNRINKRRMENFVHCASRWARETLSWVSRAGGLQQNVLIFVLMLTSSRFKYWTKFELQRILILKWWNFRNFEHLCWNSGSVLCYDVTKLKRLHRMLSQRSGKRKKNTCWKSRRSFSELNPWFLINFWKKYLLVFQKLHKLLRYLWREKYLPI